MINRRELLKGLSATAGAFFLPRLSEGKIPHKPANTFTYCLNMATIRGHNLGFAKELEVAAGAGFKGVEIWIDSLQTYLNKGGSLLNAKKRIDDLGLTVINAISFAKWIIDDESQRKQGLEQMKREMDMLAQIGCKKIAAPPIGATDAPVLELKRIAERYLTILELADKTGVVPQLEMWGFSKNLSRVSEVMYVAIESNHPSAKILLDIFHIYKGGSGIDTLSLVGKPAIEVLHINDYPPNLPASAITDADRIFPGDGVAPVRRILQMLKNENKPLVISLEIFNKNYYKLDALEVAKTGLRKMKAVTENF